jgi:hypothetical protein
MKRIAFTILIIAAATSITNAKYSGGSGADNDPYLIATAEDMNQIGQDQNDWNKCFKMTADVNLCAYSGTQFSRIGIDIPHAFSGIFNGNGHTIWNFTYTAENSDYTGIFGAVSATGRIENVSLSDVNITGHNYVGGLAGYNEGTIYKCNTTGKVASPNQTYDIGGLAGFNSGDINNCYSISAVTSGDGAGLIGGLAGENAGNISNCYSMGTIVCGYPPGDTGGLTGDNSGSISSSYFLDTSGRDNGYGTPLKDEQMKQQSSFAGWDFVWETANGTDDVWAICEDVNYPKLTWQFLPGDSDNDKDVDFVDFGRLGMKWRQAETNLYCGGMDLTGDGWVDWEDIVIMCNHWLEGT